jgi:hypothetical protein
VYVVAVIEDTRAGVRNEQAFTSEDVPAAVEAAAVIAVLGVPVAVGTSPAVLVEPLEQAVAATATSVRLAVAITVGTRMASPEFRRRPAGGLRRR